MLFINLVYSQAVIHTHISQGMRLVGHMSNDYHLRYEVTGWYIAIHFSGIARMTNVT